MFISFGLRREKGVLTHNAQCSLFRFLSSGRIVFSPKANRTGVPIRVPNDPQNGLFFCNEWNNVSSL
ncbi:hypothetical protein NHX12_019059 [Muraenolepis orangiensis]|uniref:Uncharacterized protein n=1 Tax=Muraenolepis orangiensis TaxID=630683 RepID=A0A9Q0ET22_9TELE|nr:hypothetical protein NHX12_019059 [Muraenolepis orangiensis]